MDTQRDNETTLEKIIVELLLTEIVRQSDYEFAISYDNGFDTDEEQMVYTRVPAEALKHVQACGDERIMIRNTGDDLAFAWIWLVYGNGPDVITDYTASAEKFVTPVLDWIDENAG